MRVYATELICSTEVLGFHTFKLALCIYNKLRSHAEILSWWAFDVTFPGSNPLRSNRSGLNVSNGGAWNPKFTLRVNSFWIKIKGQNFASQVLSRHTFKIPRKKGSDFFDHRGTLTTNIIGLIVFSIVFGIVCGRVREKRKAAGRVLCLLERRDHNDGWFYDVVSGKPYVRALFSDGRFASGHGLTNSFVTIEFYQRSAKLIGSWEMGWSFDVKRVFTLVEAVHMRRI